MQKDAGTVTKNSVYFNMNEPIYVSAYEISGHNSKIMHMYVGGFSLLNHCI